MRGGKTGGKKKRQRERERERKKERKKTTTKRMEVQRYALKVSQLLLMMFCWGLGVSLCDFCSAAAALAENSVPKQLPVTFTRELKILERSLGALLPSYLNQHGIAVLDM